MPEETARAELGRNARAAVLGLIGLLGAIAPLATVAEAPVMQPASDEDAARIEAGRRIYMEGVLPSVETMTGIVQGDIGLTGQQVICGLCHRRSGLGSTEGQEVVPPVTGDILYEPLRLPTSKPPLAPEQRPAYTDDTLKRAIRDGIDAKGEPLNPLMPRYPLSDEQLDLLIAYLKSMTTDPDPGVTEREMHFATIISDAVDPATRKAFLDVLEAYFQQKNVETRNETQRAEHAPWHKEWVLAPYRKWVLHVWDLDGPPASWNEQLEAHHQRQPVFAVLSGLATGSWRPIHDFCEMREVPCLFPLTDVPVVDEQDFYSVYLSMGMTLEADAIARHLSDEGMTATPLVQVYRADDAAGTAAAARLRSTRERRGEAVTDSPIPGSGALTDALWDAVLADARHGTLVLWLGEDDLAAFWARLQGGGALERLYLSTSLFDLGGGEVPPAVAERVFFVHPYELPRKLPRLLVRSTGWLKAKRIYAADAKRVQANAFFAMKIAGEAVKAVRGYFVREYLLERVEHMMDNATYTSVYPRVGLAPGQRFVSRGAYIAQLRPDASRELIAVTDWLVPTSDVGSATAGSGDGKAPPGGE